MCVCYCLEDHCLQVLSNLAAHLSSLIKMNRETTEFIDQLKASWWKMYWFLCVDEIKPHWDKINIKHLHSSHGSAFRNPIMFAFAQCSVCFNSHISSPLCASHSIIYIMQLHDVTEAACNNAWSGSTDEIDHHIIELSGITGAEGTEQTTRVRRWDRWRWTDGE